MSAWGRMLIFIPALKAFTISHDIHIERRSVPYGDLRATHTHKKNASLFQLRYTTPYV